MLSNFNQNDKEGESTPIYLKRDVLSSNSPQVLGFHNGTKWLKPNYWEEKMKLKRIYFLNRAPRQFAPFIQSDHGNFTEGCYSRKIYDRGDTFLKKFIGGDLPDKINFPYWRWLTVGEEEQMSDQEDILRQHILFDEKTNLDYPFKTGGIDRHFFEKGADFVRQKIGIREYHDISPDYIKDIVRVIQDNATNKMLIYNEIAKANSIILTKDFEEIWGQNDNCKMMALALLLMYQFKYYSEPTTTGVLPVVGKIGEVRSRVLRRPDSGKKCFRMIQLTKNPLSRYMQRLIFDYDGPADMFKAFCIYIQGSTYNDAGKIQLVKEYVEWMYRNDRTSNTKEYLMRDKGLNRLGIYLDWVYMGKIMDHEDLLQIDKGMVNMLATVEFSRNSAEFLPRKPVWLFNTPY